MRAVTGIALIFILAGGVSQTAEVSVKKLLDEHRYVDLYQVAHAQKGSLYKGVSAAIFNEPNAEDLLRHAIREAPKSDDAYEAYDWLANIYLRTGRYRSFMATMDARWAAFPDKKDVANEKKECAPFRGLPDQSLIARRASTLKHEANSFAVTLTINGKPAKFFFDNGADVSSISLNEARRLGMEIHDVTGSMNTMTQRANFRTAVARDVVIGKLHFKDVSFAVFPDDQEPWSLVPLGERGILGLPLMTVAKTFHWSADGTLSLGEKAQTLEPRLSNLFFDKNHVVFQTEFQGQKILTSLDTGAMTTDVYAPFAHQFSEYLSRVGTSGKNEIRGIGGAQTYDSTEVPELQFIAGGQEVTLRPAHIYTQHQERRPWIMANFGKDLLTQSSGFTIDFNAMKLTLDPGQNEKESP